ncbi:hypothetical protein [Pseudoteredinibacter isoporae]|uniref:Solute-binding protein family 3/N-terminal domain-containing protein n=1 Tax=Pseudoteredinibacter isoporae TaxID=570281 RepID=A0A7X0JW33_9GAMM|nr:hypothetical protein [Pseudoteredinibacter isoporae]MBB6522476.1 hypothetical protein [Pseudoteredinibacter isoporae]NHO88006.1 hypothetical protein [Pseudoteredinibacter isoporae]NIB23663.1 hypothetical protein [Pseudoteredinibacter isoporae]
MASEPSDSLEVIYVDMPPFTFLNEQDKADGILIRKTAAALKKINQPHHFRRVTLQELAQLSGRADLGLVHLIGAFPVPKQSVSFGSRPLSYMRLHAYFTDAKPIRARSDLRNKEVILVKGYSYGYLRDYLNIPENRVRILFAESHEQALQRLNAKPGRYLLNYERPFASAVGQSKLESLQQYSLSEIPIYWAAGNSFAGQLPELEAQLP